MSDTLWLHEQLYSRLLGHGDSSGKEEYDKYPPNQIKEEKVGGLTEDLHEDCGLWLGAILRGDHALVDAGIIDVGIVDGEGGRGVIVPYHRDPLLVWGELLSVGGEPGDVFIFGISGH